MMVVLIEMSKHPVSNGLRETSVLLSSLFSNIMSS